MKVLTAILLLLSLVLPGSMVAQAVAAPTPEVCTVADGAGGHCCAPDVTSCCCDATPLPEAPPAPPVPQPTSSSGARDIAASLPTLLVLAELLRLADSTAQSAPFSDHALDATAPPVRLCVLRCSLLL